MFKITDGEVEPGEREDLYHFAPPELDECPENGARVHLVSELHSSVCPHFQNESYCTANAQDYAQSKQCRGASNPTDATAGFTSTSLDFFWSAH
jgi:hypothetical protein